MLLIILNGRVRTIRTKTGEGVILPVWQNWIMGGQGAVLYRALFLIYITTVPLDFLQVLWNDVANSDRKQRKTAKIVAILYGIPLPALKDLLFNSADRTPICHRCDCTVDREYMHFGDRCGQRIKLQTIQIL